MRKLIASVNILYTHIICSSKLLHVNPDENLSCSLLSHWSEIMFTQTEADSRLSLLLQ